MANKGEVGRLIPAKKAALRPAPVQARAKQRRERVLDAAETVFAAVGYEAATTRLIANGADTSVGSLYGFFSNKEAIAAALCERYTAELEAVCDEAVANGVRSWEVTAAELVDAIHDLYSRRPGLQTLQQAACGAKTRESLCEGFTTTLVGYFEQLIEMRRTSTDPIRRHIVAGMCGHVLRCNLGAVAEKAEHQRAACVAEVKLALGAYLTTAVPP